MNIMYYSSSVSLQGGAENNMYYLVSEMAKKHNVFVCLNEDEGIAFRYREIGVKVIILPINRLSYKYGIVYLVKSIIDMRHFINMLRTEIKKNKIDILHANDIIDVFSLIAGKLEKVRTIAYLRFIPRKYSLSKFIARFIIKNYAEVVICVSKAVKRNWFNNKKFAVVINDGIKPPSLIVNRTPKNVITLISIGKLVSINGHHNVIKAIARLSKSEKSNLIFRIIGGTISGHEKYYRYLVNLIKKNSLEKVCILEGFKDNVYDYLISSDIFCFGTTWQHAFPNVILEAMSVGLPVISYSSGGINEQISNNNTGLLVFSLKNFSEKLSILLNDEVLRGKIGYSAKIAFIQNFTIEKQIEKLDSLYEKIGSNNETNN